MWAGVHSGQARQGKRDAHRRRYVVPAGSLCRRAVGKTASGGTNDFTPYSKEMMGYRPAKADRILRDGDKVSMTNTFPLALPAGRTEVKPPGIPLHFMLIGTSRAFAVGQRVPMRLRFERAGVVEVVFTVAEDSAGTGGASRQCGVQVGVGNPEIPQGLDIGGHATDLLP